MIITLYSLLNVTNDAAPEVIEASYKALCKKLHPDNRETGDHVLFTQIGEAYAVLSDPRRRQEYDFQLKQKISVPVGINDPLQGGRELLTVKRLDGSDTWCTIDEHVKRNGTELEKTCLDRVILKNIKLQSANLDGCRMNHGIFENITLVSSSMKNFEATNSTFASVKFEGVVLDNAVFSNCDFRGSSFASMTLSHCKFIGCLLDGVSFGNLGGTLLGFGSAENAANIRNCQFKSCSMSATIFSSSAPEPARISCSKVDFSGSNLSSATFAGSLLQKCIFSQSVLVGANFYKTTLADIDISSCNLVNARFHDAQLESVSFPPGFNPVAKVSVSGESQFRRAPIKLELGNGVSMELIWCPPGSFVMGSPLNEKGRKKNEEQRTVKIPKGFWIGETPVTQLQWETVMGFNPSQNLVGQFLGLFGGRTQPENPVETVQLYQVTSFINSINRLKNSSFRFDLPSEYQWEYACRAGTQTAYYFGNDVSMLKNHAWANENSGGVTKPVGQKSTNSIGLFDLYGNVYELCYKDNDKNEYVVRGGSFLSSNENCRSAFRNFEYTNYCSSTIGLRLVANPVG